MIRSRGEGKLCRKDKKPHAAYVDTLEGAENVGRATHMLSGSPELLLSRATGSARTDAFENQVYSTFI